MRPKRRKPFPLILKLAAFCVVVNSAGAGCAGCGCETCEESMHDNAYNDERNKLTDRHDYEAPVSDTWKEMVKLLGEHGYTLSPVVVEGSTVESDWVSGPGANRERVLVRVDRRSAKHYRVEIRHQGELHEDGIVLASDPPDHDLEWQLLQRVEPAKAKAIEDEAEKAGNRAGTVGRGCDRGCEAGCTACVACADTCERCDRTVKKVAPP